MIDMSDAYEEWNQRAARAMEIARRLYPKYVTPYNDENLLAPISLQEFCRGEFDAWTAREWRDLWVWLSSDYRSTERADRELEELQRYVQDRYFGLRFG